MVTGADAQVEASTADDIKHRSFFRNQNGVVQRQHDYGGADADVFGSAGYHAGEGPDARQQSVAGETVFAKPDFVDAKLVGQFDLFHALVEGLLLSLALVPRNDGEDSKLHRWISFS